MTDLRIRLTEKQSQFDRLIRTTENVFYGGAKGGGKSHGLREIMLKRRIEIPESYGVIFRKTYPELYNNHIFPLLRKFPVLKEWYQQGNKEIHFPNKSVLAFRHCQYEKDLGLHQGQEYHDLAIEEAGEWPEDWFWTLKGSNRSGRPGIQPRCLLTGNPGGIGHKWLKRLFIDRNYRPEAESPEDFGFVPALVYDNPALMKNDPTYIKRLKAHKNPMLVKAYLEGSWDIRAGQYFDVVSRNTHVVEPFEIPDHWERMAMFDYGYNHPSAFIWLTSDSDGNCYVYREYGRAGRRPEEVAHDVMDMMEDGEIEKLSNIPAGHDCWTKHRGDPSIEEKFSTASDQKLILVKAAIDRVPGAQHLRDYLALNKGKPRLYFFSTCPMTYDAVTRMTHSTKNPEDVQKVDAEDGDPFSGDDFYDALRYGVMDRPKIAVEPPPQKKKNWYDDDGPADAPWTAI